MLKKGIKYMKGSGAGLLLGIALLGSFTVVPEGHRGIKTRFSEAVGVTTQGFQFKLPFIESIHPLSVMAEGLEIKNAEGATKDTQPVHTTLVVRYRKKDKDILNIYTEWAKDGNLDNYVYSGTLEAFKAVTAKYDATELISKRNEVSVSITNAIASKVEKYGIEVLNVDMTQFTFSGDYMKAISQKVTEEQQKLAEINKLERIKVEQQQKVVNAQAEAEAKIAEAKGKAEAVRLEALALQANQSILELRRIEVDKIKAERWDGKLPSTVMGGAIPMVNLSNSK